MGRPNDLPIDDLEMLLREIDEFNTATGNNKPVDIPQTLENYLQFVAKSGNTVFPWPHVRTLFRAKMILAIEQFQEPTCTTEGFVLERFDMFRNAAPFTIQRLTELIIQPTRHYRKKEKFMRGLEKTVLVVSTIEPSSLTGENEKNGTDDTINTSASSCEAETENVTFNRTYSVDSQDNMVTVHSSPIALIGQNIALTSDGIIDSVTTSMPVINQGIGVSSDVILTESVTTSTMSPVDVDVITPDIAIAVSTESIILNAVVSDTSAAVVSMESDDELVAAECESSTTNAIEMSPVALLQCVAEQDLVSTAMRHATEETMSETDPGLEDVSLVNMDAVKLPLDDVDDNVVDCDSSASSEAASLFHCANPEASALVTELRTEPPEVGDIASVSDSAHVTISSDSPTKTSVLEVSEHQAEPLPTNILEGQPQEDPSPLIQLQTQEDTSPSTVDPSDELPQVSGSVEESKLEEVVPSDLVDDAVSSMVVEDSPCTDTTPIEEAGEAESNTEDSASTEDISNVKEGESEAMESKTEEVENQSL